MPPALSACGSAAVEALHHRAQLAALEAAEARDQAFLIGLLVGATGGLGLLAGFAITLLVAVLTWNDLSRRRLLAAVAALYLLGAAACLVVAVKRIQRWRPFQTTCE